MQAVRGERKRSPGPGGCESQCACRSDAQACASIKRTARNRATAQRDIAGSRHCIESQRCRIDGDRAAGRRHRAEHCRVGNRERNVAVGSKRHGIKVRRRYRQQGASIDRVARNRAADDRCGTRCVDGPEAGRRRAVIEAADVCRIDIRGRICAKRGDAAGQEIAELQITHSKIERACGNVHKIDGTG